ncbi:MAG: beta-propeller domain-containing protein [Patescibacteria group bacterium]|nr:beta-propeller domain-containing protein [Patescibacteria group bacterium]
MGITENGVQISNIDCNQISYVLPDDEDLKLSPRFTIVSKINIQKIDSKVDTTALLSPEGELHMTKNALYLVSHYYTPRTFYCPLGMFCTYGYYRGGTTQTLVHKFALENTDLVYKNSSLIGGTMLNQYSMDEDSKGNFRILTESNGTNLYVFDHNFELAGKLEGIEPDEEFKSSRYIEDKLYLVTWHEIDPLFVIDLENPKNPQILGELEIPGYSKYLHPLKKEGDKQYLIGLGYNTADNGRGGFVNSGLKISLFEIDYAKKEKNQIAISEIANYSTGGNGSYSSVLENPRLFVMNSKGEVTLPMTISTQKEEGQNCNITYDNAGKETGKNCYPITKTEYFRGLKSFAISPENGIKEIFTKDYATGTLAEKIGRNTRYLERMRVGFAGDVLFTINDLFADFIFPNEEEGATLFFK